MTTNECGLAGSNHGRPQLHADKKKALGKSLRLTAFFLKRTRAQVAATPATTNGTEEASIK